MVLRPRLTQTSPLGDNTSHFLSSIGQGVARISPHSPSAAVITVGADAGTAPGSECGISRFYVDGFSVVASGFLQKEQHALVKFKIICS